MSKVKITATRAHTYAGKWHEVGDVFEANEQDARTLEAIGKAKRHVAAAEPAPVIRKPPPLRTRAEPETLEDKSAAYKTRDMKAEG